MRCGQLTYAILYLAIASTVLSTRQYVCAQVVVPDDTLGDEQSIVNISTDNEVLYQQIEGGAIRGSNLFHSFRDFNIAEGQSLYFQSSVGVENIITRVTGDSFSYIDGTLGVLGGNSDVFLLNPNGILFGPNARLDIGGSFVATTAPTVQFGTEGFFSSTLPDSPPLLSVDPSAFFFNQVSPAAIINQSTVLLSSGRRGLEVPDNENLLLLGGDINLIAGGVNASGGRVELGAVSGMGIVELSPDDSSNLRLSYPANLARADISLTDGATVNTSGEGGGPIQIWGRRVFVNGGSQIAALTQGANSGSSVIINASESLQVVGFVPFGNISTVSFGDGKAGDLIIETQRLQVLERAQIFSGTVGNGSGGRLSVNASDFVEVAGPGNAGDDQFSSIASFTGRAGRAGNVTVNTSRLIVRDRGVLTTESLPVLEDGQFLPPSGEGGDLVIDASDFVELSREGLISTETEGIGNAGSLTINTVRLLVQDESRVNTESFSSGNAGDIAIQAQSIALENQSQIQAVTEASQGGNITLQVSDFILLRQDSSISTEAGTAQAGGDGGDITLNLPDGFVVAVPTENSDIRANAFEGNGGDVNITARSLLGIALRPNVLDTPLSDITASSQFGSSGLVSINELNPEIPQNDLELPVDTAPPALAQGCETPAAEVGSFVVTGSGGLPTDPTDMLGTDNLWQDIAPLTDDSTEDGGDDASSMLPETATAASAPDAPIVEAQSWTRNDDGTVTLLAQTGGGDRSIPTVRCSALPESAR